MNSRKGIFLKDLNQNFVAFLELKCVVIKMKLRIDYLSNWPQQKLYAPTWEINIRKKQNLRGWKGKLRFWVWLKRRIVSLLVWRKFISLPLATLVDELVKHRTWLCFWLGSFSLSVIFCFQAKLSYVLHGCWVDVFPVRNIQIL